MALFLARIAILLAAMMWFFGASYLVKFFKLGTDATAEYDRRKDILAAVILAAWVAVGILIFTYAVPRELDPSVLFR